jgi:6-phosphogluconolactonase (cycloisomerase 2 family)
VPLVFPLAADGDVAPTRRLDDISRSIESQIAIDRSTGELYVVDGFPGVVRVYAANASGPATLIRTNTGLVSPSGVGILFGQLFVSDEQTGDIRVFRLEAEGDTTPLRVLSTAINGGGSLGHLSVTRDEIYVVNRATDSVAVYPINATGPTPATRSFAGSTPGLPFHALGVATF